MSPVRQLITGDKFVSALLELGIVDNRTHSVTIKATVGEAILLTIEKFGDDRLLQLVEGGGVTITHDPSAAVAK